PSSSTTDLFPLSLPDALPISTPLMCCLLLADLLPANVLRVVHHRLQIVVGIDHPARLRPLLGRKRREHLLELSHVRNLEIERRGDRKSTRLNSSHQMTS